MSNQARPSSETSPPANSNNNNNNSEQQQQQQQEGSALSDNLRDLLNSDFNGIINVNGLTNQLNNVLSRRGPEEEHPQQQQQQLPTSSNSARTSEMQQQHPADHQIVLDLLNQQQQQSSSSNSTLQNTTTNPQPEQQQQQRQVLSEIDASGGGAGGNAGNQQQTTDDGNPANGFFMLAVKTLQSSLPFLIILIAKIFHQHLLGFFIVLGFMTTLHWSNRTLVNQVQMKEKKRNHQLALLIAFLMSNVLIFFYIFRESSLENCLIFMPTHINHMDTWNLIWIVVCSDTIIKFITISIKATVTLMPFGTVPLRKRGNYYSAIEQLGLFYRILTPIHPWILFLLYSPPDMMFIEKLSNERNALIESSKGSMPTANAGPLSSLPLYSTSSTSSSKNFPIFLCILYVIFKLNQVYNGFSELCQAIKELTSDITYGFPVTLSEQAEQICPICQDKYMKPVSLKCGHTFCLDCVSVWLDKENSCPMCRQRITVKKPTFKDGTTTILIQWF